MCGIRYIAVENKTLKLTKLTDARARIYRESVRFMCFDLLIKVRLFPLNVHRLLKLNLIPGG